MSQEQKEKFYRPVNVYSLDGCLIKECVSVKSAASEFNVCKNTVIGVAKGAIQNPEKFIFKYK